MGTALLEGTQGNEFNCYHLGDSMNKRITQLAEQATSTQGPTPYNPLTFEVFDKEKFAELIVRECAEVVYSRSGHATPQDLYEHFGVEE